ncbi:MAG: trypsin-like peptidase domain-containing protein [Planctomycetales bacterium]|nr:trypsin-like peptidase domain-containing protein [Planctomycetales bacterium]
MGSLKFCALLLALAGLSQQAVGQETILLDFTADWCGPCQQMRPVVERLERNGYAVRVVNIDREPKLAARFGVAKIPCFVAVANGREIGRQLGATSYEQLAAMLGSQNSSQHAATQTVQHDPFLAGSGHASAQGQSLADLPPARQRDAAARAPLAAADATRNAPAAGTAQPPSELSVELVAATVRIRVEDPDGHSYGTGTIVDARQGEALILTCGHLFRDSGGKGLVTVDFQRNGQAATATARLLGFDLKRDLGVLTFRPEGEVRVAPLAPADRRVACGDWVMNVGCNHGAAPSPRSSRITDIDKYLGPANFEVSGTPVEGRSGGGLFNQQGELIGICYAADPEDNEGVYAALTSIHAEVARLNLSKVLSRSSEIQLAARDAATEAPVAEHSMPDEFPQEPAGLRSVVLNDPQPPRNSAVQLAEHVESVARGEMTAAERATLDEIANRSRDAEVICVIRPLNDPNAKSEIIVLDRASPEFLRQLTERKRISDSRQLTSHGARSAAVDGATNR